MERADQQKHARPDEGRRLPLPADDVRHAFDGMPVWDNQFGSVVAEQQFVRRATLDDLDEGLFRGYLRKQGFGLRRVRQPDIVPEYRNFGVVADREDGPAPTLFGILAFGREPQRFPRNYSFLVRNTAYKGTGRGLGVLLAGEGKGRLDEQVDRTLHWARSFGWREIPGVPVRTDLPVLPIAALREAVVNAVVHRDYAIPSPVLVDVFPDRVEITNPGTLPPGLTPAMLCRGGITRTRNEAMAHYAASVRLMEQRGMGWPTIADAMHEFNGTEPRIEEDRETAWVSVTLDLHVPKGDHNA